MALKICKPYKGATPSSITQGFHPAHQAVDMGGKYGQFLLSPFNARVLTIVKGEGLSTDTDPLRGGYGVRLQSTEDPTLAMVYWHCLPFFPVSVGDIVLQGQPVAQMGNSGFVLSGGKYVEIDIRTIPPFPGTHVHWTMGRNNADGTYTPLDPSTLIDWTIPVGDTGILEAIKKVLANISKLFK
jgi:murein DD-endopeptidase MepM/ murein hydrolase activator NlpD